MEPRKPDLIAEKVLALYADPALRSDLGSKARKFVEQNHSMENMADKVEKLYEKLTHQSS
jgi:glycosyltransferase involved in cell wall biosynthesis